MVRTICLMGQSVDINRKNNGFMQIGVQLIRKEAFTKTILIAIA
jgi:hypothetical protein